MRLLKLAVLAACALLIHSCGKDTRTPADHILGDWYIDTSFAQTYFNGVPGTGSISIVYPYNLLFDKSGLAYFIQFKRTDTTDFHILDERHLVMDLNNDYRLDSVTVKEYQYQRRIDIWGVVDSKIIDGNLYETVYRYALSRDK